MEKCTVPRIKLRNFRAQSVLPDFFGRHIVFSREGHSSRKKDCSCHGSDAYTELAEHCKQRTSRFLDSLGLYHGPTTYPCKAFSIL